MLTDFYTYAWLRNDGTPYYIGKGREDRAFLKYRKFHPKDETRVLILKRNLTEDEAFKHESYLIFILGRKDLGTGILHNRTSGGDGFSGGTHSEETRARIREKLKGIQREPFSEEHLTKLRKAHEGKTHTEETKAKMSLAHKGKTHSEESRVKMSKARKGKPGKSHSEETKTKISAAQKGRPRKPHSEETRAKISERLRKHFEEVRAKLT